MNTTVMIDDMRHLSDFGVTSGNMITIRTHQAAEKFVFNENMSDVTLYLDNDLGDDNPFNDGYDILCKMFSCNNYPKTVYVVTSNPPARSKMFMALYNEGYDQVTTMYPFCFVLTSRVNSVNIDRDVFEQRKDQQYFETVFV